MQNLNDRVGRATPRTAAFPYVRRVALWPDPQGLWRQPGGGHEMLARIRRHPPATFTVHIDG